jgi:hypothetical protein
MLFGFGFGPSGLDEGWRLERRQGRREWMRGHDTCYLLSPTSFREREALKAFKPFSNRQRFFSPCPSVLNNMDVEGVKESCEHNPNE